MKIGKETRRRIGHRLRKARTTQGVTIEQAAERVAISYNHLLNIEHGRSASIKVLAKVADLMGYTLERLIAEVAPNREARGSYANRTSVAGMLKRLNLRLVRVSISHQEDEVTP